MNTSRQQMSDTQQPDGFFTSAQIAASASNIINWLVGLIQLTDEEQKDAGIYLLGSQGYE